MKTQQLRKGLFQFTTVRIHSITAGRQGRNSNRAGNSRWELKQRDYGRVLVTDFLPMGCSTCFHIALRITPAMAPPTMS